MKKTVLILAGIAMVAFTNTTLASNERPFANYKVEVTKITNISPLCLAISKGDIETVKKFIELGSDVNQKSAGMTPLMYAARYNKVEIIKLLIANGAKLKVKDNKGFTALKHAELSNATDAVALIEKALKA
ncbi:ankyrin repeat domain-containing protein [Sinomicrobium weinanense]|uniref:Ankyrin repeat domain-containing protein n=1 Tax=Sinomicrobium weinanense TaxID=2842200 RepID=A0A926JRH4_9FLAO|nr:ankyrin repeat domain-containing protein [Sinomicrobium weinanense]MBC9795948.1 ankyrin repeat domain-containing protein [Sinomicrobium weinanense]MBU3122067.1 ankyrin repeat domain-containing protein [Sinomicrobium weinanense]